MAGFVIHLAVAKEYINKNNDISDKDKFLIGAIAPDMNDDLTDVTTNKKLTHYGSPVNPNIKMFLEEHNNDLDKDYWKGYLLHLVTDYYFYKVYFNKELDYINEHNLKFYDDYDCLNKYLIDKYDVDVFENIKRFILFKENEPLLLKKDRVVDFIDDISNKELDYYINIFNKKIGI